MQQTMFSATCNRMNGSDEETEAYLYSILYICCTVCLKKNIPNIFSCNSRMRYRILIIFGTRVTEKVSNQ